MKTTASLLLAVGTCGAGFLAVWLVIRSDGTSRIDNAPLAQSTQGMERAAQEQPLALERASPEQRESGVPVPAERRVLPVLSTRVERVRPTWPARSDPRMLPETTIAEMKVKREALDARLNEESGPFLLQRIKDGQLEHYTDDSNLKSPDSEEDRALIAGYTSRTGKGWDRAVLPRDQYPGLYELKDETLRLDKLVKELGLAEYQAGLSTESSGSDR